MDTVPVRLRDGESLRLGSYKKHLTQWLLGIGGDESESLEYIVSACVYYKCEICVNMYYEMFMCLLSMRRLG